MIAGHRPTAVERGGGDHWERLAKGWELSGPPLRVSPQDVEAYRRAVERWRGARPPRALLLGVTPELFRLGWPRGTDLVAADREQAMIEMVWPGPPDRVVREDWTDLSLGDRSRDIVLCDGGFHLLDFPNGQSKLVNTLARILDDDGICALRLFVPPAQHESPEAVLDDLIAGRIPSVNVLKLRLGMALQADAVSGVQLGKVWAAFNAALAGLDEELATGWPQPEIGSMDAYRDSRSRYHFVGPGEVERLFCEDPGHFVLESLDFPRYELGERCPLIGFRRRPR